VILGPIQQAGSPGPGQVAIGGAAQPEQQLLLQEQQQQQTLDQQEQALDKQGQSGGPAGDQQSGQDQQSAQNETQSDAQAQAEKESEKNKGDQDDDGSTDASLGLINTAPVQMKTDLEEPVTSGGMDTATEGPGNPN
jgi:hypothetical protein